MKKALALLLALLMIAGLLAGCGGGNKEETPSTAPTASTNDNTNTTSSAPAYEGPDETDISDLGYELPLTEENIKFTYWIPNSTSFEGFSTYDDNVFYQWMEDQTGVDIVFEHPAVGSETEAFQTMILSGDYPEFVQGIKSRYTGGVDKAIEDNVLLRLNEYVDMYMPHYRKVVYATEETFIQAVSDNGNLWGIHHIVDVPQGAWIGLGVREDLLNKAGLDVSDCETIDGLETAMIALKDYTYENAGPLWLSANSTTASDAICGSFGFGSTLMGHQFMNVNGTVVYGPIQPGAQRYAAKMAEWYAKGLINKDYVGTASWGTPQDKWVNGEMAVGDFVYTNDEMFKSAAAVSDLNPCPDFLIQALTCPKEDASQSWDDIHLRNTQGKIRPGNSMGITVTALPNIELACHFWDFAWTEEGKSRANWASIGEKGDINCVSYDDPTDANGDGHTECYQDWTMAACQNNVTYVQTKYAVHNGPTWSIWSREWCTLNPRQIEYQNIWNKVKDDYVMPEGITLTTDEGVEASSIVANCNTTWHEWLVAVITGEKSADTWQTEVVDVINGLGIDIATGHYQAALDRYNARIQYIDG